jgi:hypothetical protein
VSAPAAPEADAAVQRKREDSGRIRRAALWAGVIAGHVAVAAALDLGTRGPAASPLEARPAVFVTLAPPPEPAPQPSAVAETTAEPSASARAPAPDFATLSPIPDPEPPGSALEVLSSPASPLRAAALPDAVRQALRRALPCVLVDPSADDAAQECADADRVALVESRGLDLRAFLDASVIDPDGTKARIARQLEIREASLGANAPYGDSRQSPKASLMTVPDSRLGAASSMRDALPPSDPDPAFGN